MIIEPGKIYCIKGREEVINEGSNLPGVFRSQEVQRQTMSRLLRQRLDTGSGGVNSSVLSPCSEIKYRKGCSTMTGKDRKGRNALV